MSKLKEYLAKEKIDTRQLMATSKRIEKMTAADRKVRLARKKVAGGKPTDAEKETAQMKRRSGRKLSAPALQRALAGEKLSKGAKKRVVRAVNAVLAQKKKGEAKHDDLF